MKKGLFGRSNGEVPSQRADPGYWRSQAVRPPSPADVFYADRNITKTRSNGGYWADGGIVSTAEEMNMFLRALNEGKIIRPASLKLMHNWRRLQFPLQYGYGTMYFKLPRPISAVTRIPFVGSFGFDRIIPLLL